MSETVSLGVNLKSLIPYNVLIVDDSKMDQLLLKQYLQSEMFRVSHIASDGTEALSILETFQNEIDIICLDHDMPNRNGIETLKSIKSLYPTKFTIMITGQANKEVVNELYKLKVNALIVKPISKAQVIEKFALVLGRKDLITKQIVAYKSTSGIDLNDLKIPAIPSVMIKVLQFDANSVAGSAELEKIITPDKAISLDILKIANSSFYGRSGTVKTLKDAITLLGLKTVKNLVILQSKKQIAGSLMGSVFKKHIQDLPILTSLVAFDLTVPLNLKGLRDEIFTLTLLRRIGATIFAMNFSKRYQDVIKLAEAGVKSIVTIEREEFGTDSIEVGLKVFHQWNMPKSYHEIVKNQDFSILNYTEVSDYDRLTRIADILSRKLYSILVSPEENELLETIFRHYKASSEIIDAFGPDYYDNIKDHPYFI